MGGPVRLRLGSGDVEVREGIFGLRRAFQIAGVRTVIMSLWGVGDEDTREWMRPSIAHVCGRSTAEALRTAELTSSARAGSAGGHAPFYWGASSRRRLALSLPTRRVAIRLLFCPSLLGSA